MGILKLVEVKAPLNILKRLATVIVTKLAELKFWKLSGDFEITKRLDLRIFENM
jgi:hypothetical protein